MSYRGRFLRREAEGLMKALLSYLRTCPAVLRAAPAGSFRRGRESVGNLNAVVATDAPEAVRSHVESWEEAQLPIVLDGAKLFFKLHAEVEADLLLVPEDRFGAAWHYQTGSAEHNRQLARLARTRGLVPQPGGLYAGQETLETRDEEAFFDRLGLPWIPPELREGRGELEAAQGSALPRLVEPGEIRGDLHMHTTFTDGTASMLEMALAAKALRYEYIAVCDHTHNVRVANGLSPDRVAQYLEEVDRVNALVGGFTVLKGLEVDILPDGTLDMPESILERLDLVIASVHSAFDQSEDLMTARVLKALDSRWVHVLGHPSGRLIGQRSPLLLDMEQVFARAAQRGKMLELNANPERLDLTDLHCRQVRQMGIPIVISTDAHSISQLANMPRGIFQARRGWLEADDILNTRPLPELRRMLAAVRGRGE
jgi:DNA polymerase (family 10)